jgi:hypothetical protein
MDLRHAASFVASDASDASPVYRQLATAYADGLRAHEVNI